MEELEARGYCNNVDVRSLTFVLNTSSCGSVVLVLLAQLFVQRQKIFEFPASVVPSLMVVALLFHACVLSGVVMHGYAIKGSKEIFCESQAVLLQLCMSLMLFGFMFISLLVYQVVVNMRPYSTIDVYTYPRMLRLVCPLALTIAPIFSEGYGPPNLSAIPFCWLDSWYQFVYWYAWVLVIVAAGLYMWVKIINRLLLVTAATDADAEASASSGEHLQHSSTQLFEFIQLDSISFSTIINRWLGKEKRGDHNSKPTAANIINSSQGMDEDEENQRRSVFRRTVLRHTGFVFTFFLSFAITLAFAIDTALHYNKQLSQYKYSTVLCLLNTVIISSIGLILAAVFAPYHEFFRLSRRRQKSSTQNRPELAMDSSLDDGLI